MYHLLGDRERFAIEVDLSESECENRTAIWVGGTRLGNWDDVNMGHNVICRESMCTFMWINNGDTSSYEAENDIRCFPVPLLLVKDNFTRLMKLVPEPSRFSADALKAVYLNEMTIVILLEERLRCGWLPELPSKYLYTAGGGEAYRRVIAPMGFELGFLNWIIADDVLVGVNINFNEDIRYLIRPLLEMQRPYLTVDDLDMNVFIGDEKDWWIDQSLDFLDFSLLRTEQGWGLAFTLNDHFEYGLERIKPFEGTVL